MKCGIIDIGTNTIRAVIYDVRKLILLNDIVFESEILTDTINSQLSEEGIDKLIGILNKTITFFHDCNADEIFCFATSAMRDVINFYEIKNTIKRQCGIKIELLNGREEAECDFIALKNNLITADEGIGIDLGGGSCQIFYFKNKQLEENISLPIGVKRLYLKFGQYQNEKNDYINQFIYDQLKTFPRRKTANLYIMGGTAKTLKKVFNMISETKSSEFDSQLLDFYEKYDVNNDKYVNIIGKRVNTIEYGIAVIRGICDYFCAEKFTVMQCGVRDGYLIKKMYCKD